MATTKFQKTSFQGAENAVAKGSQSNIITGITALMTNEQSNTYQRFLAALRSPDRVERLFRTVTSIVRGDKLFDYCAPMSVLSAAMSCVNHHLELDRFFGQCAIVPFRDGKASRPGNLVYNAQLMVMRRGLIQIALRTHLYKTIDVRPIFVDELEKIDWKTDEPVFREVDPKDSMRTRYESGAVKCDSYEDCVKAGIYGWTAFFVLKDGMEKTVTWTCARIDTHARTYSTPYQADLRKGTKSSWWSKAFPTMAEKTVLRNLILNWGPMTDDMVDSLNLERVAYDQQGTVIPAYNDDEPAYGEGWTDEEDKLDAVIYDQDVEEAVSAHDDDAVEAGSGDGDADDDFTPF